MIPLKTEIAQLLVKAMTRKAVLIHDFSETVADSIIARLPQKDPKAYMICECSDGKSCQRDILIAIGYNRALDDAKRALRAEE